MPGLFHTLGMGAESLYASRQGVDTTGHNIANAQTEGYSRQRVNLHQRDPLYARGLLIGNGAYVGNITRSHDQFIEDQIVEANQSSGQSGARYDSLQGLEVIFSPEFSAGISDEMTNFFNSLQDLSNFPEDHTVRSNVREAAKDLSTTFNRVDADLNEHRNSMNERIVATTGEITDKIQHIAKLNIAIKETEAGRGDIRANDLRDQRDTNVRDLSKQVDIHYYEDQYGMLCVRGPSDITLVDRGAAAKFDVIANSENSALFDIIVNDSAGSASRNVTNLLEGGELSSYVEVRDELVPDLINKNNILASSFIEQVNSVHNRGFGVKNYSESSGRNFFAAVKDPDHSAQNMKIDDAIWESLDAISAASSPMAPGDNVNLNDLIRLKDTKILEGGNISFTGYYANMVGNLGLEIVRAEHIKEADEILEADLIGRREAISGVSLDEEATNLLKWQAAFTASSKVITTVDEMLDTVLSLKR